jgi:hypothetical protein
MQKLPLLAALATLDIANDNHWTAEGAPRLDTLKFMTGDQSLTREAVTTAAPGVSRANPLPAEQAAAGAAQAPAGGGSTGAAPSDAPAAVQGASQGDGNGDGGSGAEGGAAETPLQRAEEVLRLAHARKAEADRAVAQASAAVDRELQAIDKARQDQAVVGPVGDYHASQQRTLAERAERMKAMKGIDLKAILPQRAQIDIAMARRTARGTQRPKII